MPTVIQVRRAEKATWSTTGVTLAAGEIGYETDTGNFKVGDGSRTWNDLAYQMPYSTGLKTSALGATLSIDNANDRVGIGTDTPAQKLDVVGTAAISGNTTIGGTLNVAGATTTLTGDLAVNGGDITTSSATATVFTSNATALYIGGNATTIGIGSGSGTTTINNATSLGGNATVGGTLAVTGNTTLGGDLAVNGATSADITTTTATATVFNTTATTLNVGQAATAVSIGATTGTATIRNATTAISGAATIAGTLGVTGLTTFNATTGAPSYAADPASANILSRKSYVDSQLRVGGVVIITASTQTDWPDNASNAFAPGIDDPGLDTAGLAGVPSGWTASIASEVLSIQTTGGTWFGCSIHNNSSGASNIRYAYQNGTNVAKYSTSDRGVTVILVRTA